MKAKTARRKLRKLEWKMAKAIKFDYAKSTQGIGKLWSKLMRDALKED